MTPSGRGSGFQDESDASNPSWSSLTTPSCFRWVTTYARTSTKSRAGPQDLVVACTENTTHCVTIRVYRKLHGPARFSEEGLFSWFFHVISTTFPQVFHRVFNSRDFAKSSEFPALLHTNYTWFSYRISAIYSVLIFSSFFIGNSRRGRSEKGRKESGIRNLWKRRARGPADHYRW